MDTNLIAGIVIGLVIGANIGLLTFAVLSVNKNRKDNSHYPKRKEHYTYIKSNNIQKE